MVRGTLEDPVAGIGFHPLAVSLTVIADAEGEHWVRSLSRFAMGGRQNATHRDINCKNPLTVTKSQDNVRET